MIRYKEIRPQECDMGSNYAVYEISEPTTLFQALNWIKKNKKDWGTITIYYKNGNIVRKFDYDLHNDHQFYYHLSWEGNEIVKEMSSQACFMCCNIEIKLG